MSYTRSLASSGYSRRQAFNDDRGGDSRGNSQENSRENSESDEYEEDRRSESMIESENAWKAGCSECYDCHELIPHRLLYACGHKRCYGYLETNNASYTTPFEFYATEKLFCSGCSFTGNHKRHSEEMEESRPLAQKLAAKDKHFQEQFVKLATLDPKDPVDYFIQHEYKLNTLPVIQAMDYLICGKDTMEWIQRKEELARFKAFVEQCRLDGAKCVRELAEKSLEFYTDFVRSVEETMAGDDDRESKKKSDQKKRRSGGSMQSSSSSSRRALESVVVKTEQSATPPKETPEADESTAKMICRSLSLHYDQIRADMHIERVLQDVAQKLHAITGSMENKMAAAKMFREKHGVALFYPPQN